MTRLCRIVSLALVGGLWVLACSDGGMPPGEVLEFPDAGMPPGEVLEFPIVEEVDRTPDARFENLPDYDFEPRYVELGNLRVHYVDEGPADGVPVVLLHGEPSWSYLYRNVVPPIVAAGHRAIVPDLVGFGKSDKPAREEDHTYDRHVLWLLGVLQSLDVQDAVLVAHDFGGPIGLRLVAENPDLFRGFVVTNTFLPMNGEEGIGAVPDFVRNSVASGPVSFVIQAGSLTTLSPEILGAYDAPYPDEMFKAGALAVPTIIKAIGQQPVPEEVDAAWEVLRTWTKPVLTAHSDGDPFLGPFDAVFQEQVPGASGQAHVVIEGGGHFVQEDRSAVLAQAIIAFIADNPL